MMNASALTDEAAILSELRQLPRAQIQEVLNFATSLREKCSTGSSRPSQHPPRGSAEALLRHFGCWELEPEEMESILQDIECFRHVEED